MNTLRSCLFTALTLSLFFGCHSPTAPADNSPAASSAVIDGVRVSLQAQLYRSSEPVTTTAPDTTVAFIRLRSQTPPLPLRIRTLVVMLNATGERWVSVPAAAPAPPTADYVQFVSAPGPQWPVGGMTTVRVTVVDNTGTTTDLQLNGVAITGI